MCVALFLVVPLLNACVDQGPTSPDLHPSTGFVEPLTTGQPSTSSVRRPVKIEEEVLRSLATRVVMPSYPETSLEQAVDGIVVVRVTYSVDGVAEFVEVLEAPDPDIREAVYEAVTQWTFAPTLLHGQPVRAGGLLTFYFQIRGQEGLVLSPDDM